MTILLSNSSSTFILVCRLSILLLLFCILSLTVLILRRLLLILLKFLFSLCSWAEPKFSRYVLKKLSISYIFFLIASVIFCLLKSSITLISSFKFWNLLSTTVSISDSLSSINWLPFPAIFSIKVSSCAEKSSFKENNLWFNCSSNNCIKLSFWSSYET